MKIVIAADHGGYNIKQAIIQSLKAEGYEVADMGTNDGETSVDYPVYAKALCKEIQQGSAELGILCCGTGIGMSMTANKQKGIRAAVLSDAFSAEMTRRHNNANVLCLGGRVLNEEQAVSLAKLFVSTPFEGGRHQRRIDMMED
ncbi:MAG: ribose 5-phosphate isomerase B [Ruminococcaceae bacterium]|nr:ribose 5-phosphate isomerase B [Oscillospiraceae bacterium]